MDLPIGRYVRLPLLALAACYAFGGSAATATVSRMPGAARPQGHYHNCAADKTAFFVDPINFRQLDYKKNNEKETPMFVNGVDYMPTQVGIANDDGYGYPDPNPLDDVNEAIWLPDLQAMRQAGVNAVKVYSVAPPDINKYVPPLSNHRLLKPGETGKIDKFLQAAWNCGDRPIFVVLSFDFGAADVIDPKPNPITHLEALKQVFFEVAKANAAAPALMGISAGNEINSDTLEYVGNPKWWSNLNELVDSMKSGYAASNARKIVTTTMVDFVRPVDPSKPNGPKYMPTVVEGEKNGFKADVWGLNAYRGYTFTDFWKQLDAAKRPSFMSEYGAPAGYLAHSGTKYVPDGPKKFKCVGYPKPLPAWEPADELPASGNPQMQFLANLVTNTASELWANRASARGNGSGGFYFEWNDEYWKGGWKGPAHVGGAFANNPQKLVQENGAYPGCYNMEGWFGLNASVQDRSNPRLPNQHVPRPSLEALSAVWALER
jgi:hypothetical protein